MADLILEMDYDITEAEAKQRKMQRQLELSQKEAGLISKEIENLNKKLDAEKQKQKEILSVIADQEQEVTKLALQLERIESGKASLEERIEFGSMDAAKEKISEMEKNLMGFEKEYEKSVKTSEDLEASIAKQNVRLEKQNATTQDIGDNIKLNQRKNINFGGTFDKNSKSITRFGKRLASLAASALFFSVVTKALTEMRKQLGEYLSQNEELSKSFAKFKGSLSVIGATLADSLVPVLKWITNTGTYILNVVAKGLSKLLGKDINQMKKLATETKKAAKETAGFDTIQIAGSSEDSASGTDTSGIGGDINKTIAGIMAIVSGALLVLGVILVFTGANIPLGLGLMAVGAIGLATSVAATWGDLDDKIKERIGILTAIISGALLVLGVILAFSGANIPLGIGLIALGAVGLAATKSLAWDSMEQSTKNTITGIMAIGGALFILLGLALILTGAGIPLGIGLLILGVGMLWGAVALTPGDSFVEKVSNLWKNVRTVTSQFVNWWTTNVINKIFGEGMGKTIQDMFKSFMNLFEDIISFFVGVFTGNWKKAWRSLVNVIVDILNLTISNINSMIQFILGGGAQLINLLGKAFGKEWKLNASWAKIPTIPRLATGAVIPGGSPFLAWLGDQRKGQTNIEAPADLIRQIVREESGSKNFRIEATGSMAQLIRLLALQITEENNRASVF